MSRTAIISDIHANLHALSAVMEDVQHQLCTELACLGDVVGYNAYPAECLDYIRSLGCLVVKGNHDQEVAVKSEQNMNPTARQAMEWTRSRLNQDQLEWLEHLPFMRLVRSVYSIVHATLDAPMAWNYIINANDSITSFRRQFCPLCFHGHTHVPVVYIFDGENVAMNHDVIAELRETGEASFALSPGLKYFVNAGSVGQPRDGDPRSCYAIYDDTAQVVTLRRVAYDVAAAQQAILAAGLPEYLADRLAKGV